MSIPDKLYVYVALLTTETKHIAATKAIKEILWLKGLIGELRILQKIVKVQCDSSSAIYLSKNSVHHKKTKHT